MEDGDAARAGGGLPAASRTALRGPAVRRLLVLRAGKKLTAGHVRVAADALGVSERTVWRWLADAERDESAAACPGARSRVDARFTITPEVRGLPALWKGNVRAVHRELVLRAARQSPPAEAPSLTTLHRAIRRDLTPGERAGLAGGERAARKHDVFLARLRGWRNQVWETDHMQAPVLVDVDGTARRPWITWFTDCATNAITGVAVTPGHPSRESVLAALRSAVLREDPCDPFGGLPEKVRVDRGKDFLSGTVTAAFQAIRSLAKGDSRRSPRRRSRRRSSEAALGVAGTKRRPRNRLGWAVQWGTVRMLGTFVSQPSRVPSGWLRSSRIS